MEINELSEVLTDSYDFDSIEFDYQNNNFDLDNWREEIGRYHKPSIVAESWTNGQRKQARDQFSKYGLVANDLNGYLPTTEIIDLVS